MAQHLQVMMTLNTMCLYVLQPIKPNVEQSRAVDLNGCWMEVMYVYIYIHTVM